MQFRTPVRALMTSAALAAGVLLAGCNSDDIGTLSTNAKANRPIPDKLLADMADKDMDPQSPILVRLFKQEAELEVWKQNRSGRFVLLKVYPICRWSGDLGPKIKEGDRQAPEGFYQITPGLMNPNSNYYLAFNLGFPNAYDRANDRTGQFLMVHGDCSSRGCYAMTDEQIGEIFALGRESFAGGQKSLQVQAYPFRMTPLNMAKHRNSPHMAFWRMIKQGYDHFEVTHQEPKVDVCEKHYVFDAESSTGAPLSFSPRNRCPAYQTNAAIASLIQDRQSQEQREYAELVAKNTPVVPSRAGIDGGMHPTFMARLKPKNLLDGIFADNKPIVGAQPGAMGNNVNPPQELPNAAIATNEMTPSITPPPTMAAYSAPAPAPAPAPQQTARITPPAPPHKVAEAKPEQPSKLQKIGHMIGLRGSQAAAAAQAEPKAAAVAAPAATKTAPQPQQQVAEVPGNFSVMNGAAAPLPSASFDARFGSMR